MSCGMRQGTGHVGSGAGVFQSRRRAMGLVFKPCGLQINPVAFPPPRKCLASWHGRFSGRHLCGSHKLSHGYSHCETADIAPVMPPGAAVAML